jgi:hypothetical protein
VLPYSEQAGWSHPKTLQTGESQGQHVGASRSENSSAQRPHFSLTLPSNPHSGLQEVFALFKSRLVGSHPPKTHKRAKVRTSMWEASCRQAILPTSTFQSHPLLAFLGGPGVLPYSSRLVGVSPKTQTAGRVNQLWGEGRRAASRSCSTSHISVSPPSSSHIGPVECCLIQSNLVGSHPKRTNRRKSEPACGEASRSETVLLSTIHISTHPPSNS